MHKVRRGKRGVGGIVIAVAIARGIDIGVLAIVRDELVIVGKGDANEEVESGVHKQGKSIEK